MYFPRRFRILPAIDPIRRAYSFRRLLRKVSALVLAAVLASQIYVLGPVRSVSGSRVTAAPIVQPPEVYGLAAPSSHSKGIIGMTTAAAASVSEFFTAPPAPEGIDIPSEPSPAERTLKRGGECDQIDGRGESGACVTAECVADAVADTGRARAL